MTAQQIAHRINKVHEVAPWGRSTTYKPCGTAGCQARRLDGATFVLNADLERFIHSLPACRRRRGRGGLSVTRSIWSREVRVRAAALTCRTRLARGRFCRGFDKSATDFGALAIAHAVLRGAGDSPCSATPKADRYLAWVAPRISEASAYAMAC